MTETTKIICKICKLEKIRILAGMYPNSKNKKWVNEEGKQFSGNTCPTCQSERTKNKMKVMRFTRDLTKETESTDVE